MSVRGIFSTSSRRVRAHGGEIKAVAKIQTMACFCDSNNRESAPACGLRVIPDVVVVGVTSNAFAPIASERLHGQETLRNTGHPPATHIRTFGTSNSYIPALCVSHAALLRTNKHPNVIWPQSASNSLYSSIPQVRCIVALLTPSARCSTGSPVDKADTLSEKKAPRTRPGRSNRRSDEPSLGYRRRARRCCGPTNCRPRSHKSTALRFRA